MLTRQGCREKDKNFHAEERRTREKKTKYQLLTNQSLMIDSIAAGLQ